MARQLIPHSAREQGFALIEVMIAVIVLAAGLLALTALQGSLIRASADSKARSQIATYAESELERIRLGGVGGVSDSGPTTMAGDFAGVNSLTRTVAVDQYIANATGSFVLSADNANPGANAVFKRVTLTMGWVDATGGARTLSMSTDVSPLALASSNVLVDRTPPDDAGLRPIVRRVTPLSDGMIPIATGGDDNEQTAATNPKPKLLGGENGSYVSDTRYDVLTYSSDAYTPSGFARFNKRIETAKVGCTCQNSTSGFGRGDYNTFAGTSAFRPTYWGGTNYVKPAMAVSAVSSSPAAVPQSPLCDICCRDHKDPNSEPGPKFSPWTGQTAQHYTLDGAGALTPAGNGDTYLEACRVIRVDGVWRVAADPKIQDVALVATQAAPPGSASGSLLPAVGNNTSATSPRIATQGSDDFVQYVYDEVNSMFFSSTTIASEGNGMVAQSTALNRPTYVPILPTGDRRWLHARIFESDYLEADAKERLRKAAADCTGTTVAQRAQCILPYSPMVPNNITEIASWMPRAPVVGTDAIPPSLAALNSTYFNYARAYISRYNSGMAMVSPINPTDNASPAQDEQLFVQLASTAPTQAVWLSTPSPSPSTARLFGNALNPMRGYAETSAPIPFYLSWDFTSGNPQSPVTDSNRGNDPTAMVVGSNACTPGTSNNSSNPYSCTTSNNSNVQISMGGYNRIDYDNNANNPCGSGKVTQPTCVIYTFNGASVNTPNASIPAGSFTRVGGTAGKLDEIIQITIPSVSPSTNSSVTVDFNRSTQAATYTCDASGKPVWTVPCQ